MRKQTTGKITAVCIAAALAITLVPGMGQAKAFGAEADISGSQQTASEQTQTTGEEPHTGTQEIQTVAAPKKTELVKVYGERKKIRILWRKQKKYDGYEIRYSTDKKMKSGVKTVSVKDPLTNTKTVSNLKEKKTYYVQIRTVRTENDTTVYSAWSAKKKAVTLAASAPAAATLKFADWASGSKVSVRWTQVSGASGYILYRSASKYSGYKRVAVNKGNQNVRAVITAPKDKKCYYAVKAYKVSGGKKIGGEVSNIAGCVKYKKSNLGYLFPSGPPASSSAMQKYLVTVKLPVRTVSGGKSYIHLPIHKKLVSRVKGAFEDMYDAGFVVRAGDTGSYNWRMMRTVKLRSHHSYGCVVDLNWDANPMVTISQIGHSAYKPGKNRYSITPEVVEIWKKHGFCWGGDWTEKKDYMHMTFTNN